MEYLPLGNLETVHATVPIGFAEVFTVLDQNLQALAYANDAGVIHRDIKLANILVARRDPLLTKLADLGLAKGGGIESTLFKTRAGTPSYAAPEIWNESKTPYTYAVDIWSLGVVAFQLAYDLPDRDPNEGFSVEKWTSKIREAVEARPIEELTNLLSSGMLQLQPEHRLTAKACLAKVRDIRGVLQQASPVRSGSTRSEVSVDKESSIDDDSTTSTLTAVKEGSRKRQRSPDGAQTPTNTSRAHA